jgi:ComF family protein
MIRKAIRNIKYELLQLLYPHLCVACQIPIHRNEHLLCLDCYRKLPHTGVYKANNAVEKLYWGRFNFEWAYAQLHFSKDNITAKLLHGLKYDGRKEIADFLGTLLADTLRQKLANKLSTVIVPVPLHKNKLSSRGFNQSALIANALGKALNIEVLHDAVIRIKNTDTQTHKNRLERLENMHVAFEVKMPEALEYKHVILLDDVCTSGATMEGCALQVLNIKGCSVSIISAAVAMA